MCNREFKAYVVLVKMFLRKKVWRAPAQKKVKFGELELILIFLVEDEYHEGKTS